jgi:protein involved in sex pheromone biosynthesis
MGKSVDIDALLGEDTLEVTLAGHVYSVKDVLLPIFLSGVNVSDEDKDDPQYAHKQLAQLLKVDVDELKEVGFRAVGLAIQEIMKWTLESTQTGMNKSIKEAEDLANEPENP